MSHNLPLAISTEKKVYRGEKFRRILAFSCYEIDDLPIKYFDEYPVCFKDKEAFVVIYGDGNYLEFKVGALVPERDFHRAIRSVRFAGKKLHMLNEDIKKLRTEWQGTEDFKI
jgi:hypothetical protein